MAALLEPATPAVQASAEMAMAQLLSLGDDASKTRYQGLFLEAAVAHERDLVLGYDMLAELAAPQMLENQCKRWTLTVSTPPTSFIMFPTTLVSVHSLDP